mmetsp:Transcript_17670/g.2896  ORF Transcript_17670/g.2896 Transcript_17670/m.2896 type:complete len:113 (+) Transcript_17670:384-722(+)
MGIIGVNIFIMSLYNDNMSEDLENFLNVSNYVFIGIYTVEFILKILGLSPKLYFSNNWNKFDFIVLVLSYVTLLDLSILFFNATILRALRMLRVFRVVKVMSGVQRLLKTLQ